MIGRDEPFKDLQIRLAGLRPLLAGSKQAQGYLGLFDEFIREGEFGLASTRGLQPRKWFAG